MKTSSHHFKTQAPNPTSNIKMYHVGKIPNVCSCFNNASYREKQSKKRKQRPQTKKTRVPKKTSLEPKKMKQVWFPKKASSQHDSKPATKVIKIHWKQKFP